MSNARPLPERALVLLGCVLGAVVAVALDVSRADVGADGESRDAASSASQGDGAGGGSDGEEDGEQASAPSPTPTPPPPPPPPPELPRGGRQIFPDYRVVAAYGGANTPVLGVLGEGTPEEAAGRLALRAEPFDSPERPILPAFELIATVAQARPGDDGLYRAPTDEAVVQTYLDAARSIGALLVLDIQPGRSDFLTEVRRYERFLQEPDVGVALDPEWRMAADEVPGRVIGEVSAAEVNQVVDYLDGIVRERDLPQKLLIVHQFRLDMLPDRQLIETPDTLAVTIHADGFGTQGVKTEVYDVLTTDPAYHYGFKLFIDEDTDMFEPAEALALTPSPDLITYQ